MIKCVHKPAYLFFLAVLLFAVIVPVFGRGGQESDLARADEFISNREFNEAMLLLSDFSRRNPDHFDSAQMRLQRIFQTSDEFADTIDELIDILMNDPENNERILYLTRHLYTLEHESHPIMVHFVARTREIAQFNINRVRLRRILERGRYYLDIGDSLAAFQTYADGMDFMREEFFLSGYGVNIENEVRRETERVNMTLAAFQNVGTQLAVISEEYVRVVNAGDLARVGEISNRLTPAMDRFIALKQELYSSANVFERILNGIRADSPEIGDRNHLAFVSVVINGRTGESIQEGMLGAFDAHWKRTVGSVVNAITLHAERAKNSSIAALRAENYSGASISVERIESFVNLTPPLFNRHRQLLASSNPQTITLYGNNVLRSDIPSFIELRALSEANNILLRAANTVIQQNFDRTSLVRWQAGNITTAEALRNEEQTRRSTVEIQRYLENLVTNGNQVNNDINRHHEVRHITDAIEAIENIHRIFFTEESLSAHRYYTIAQQSLHNSLAERRSQMERGINFLNGEIIFIDPITIVYHYPTEALQELTAMLTAVTNDLENANTVLGQYRREPQAIASIQEISETNTRYLAAINELNAIRSQGLALAETARTRSAQAETFRLEGERFFREAQTAYQRQDYDTAWERLEQASERFNSSLEIQESPPLREMRDTQLITLGQAISIATNEIIIQEVRNLINTARNAYFNGNFQLAEESLVRARNRWRITSPNEENDEVMYWLGIVRTALAMNTGRVIHPTAPLYPEMSQLLNQAQRNFEEGMRLVNTGQRPQGLARFDEARQLTREVRLMFPLNQEAGILDLRIEQFIDPEAFNASFEQRLRTAINGTRTRSMEAFADLQNLAEINPRYPNIRGIILQAEIDIGLRPPPPNPANIARSRELTISASRIVDAQTTAQYEVARAQLDEAISLNPDNTEALRVRDRLLGRMNVPGTIILTSEDEAEYQLALREFNLGNNLSALTILQRIMENPRNRNIMKVQELHQRILSVL
jgi:hypothetical protein